LASGLALVDPVQGMAIAFNAAPGTVGPEEPGPYGAFATSLTEMIAAGGLSLDDIFARVRLRVSDLTRGAEIPWYVSQIDGPFFMTERAAAAPPPPNVAPVADIRGKPMREFSSAEDAYEAALERDTIEGMSSSSRSIRTTRIPGASPPCSLFAAKRSSGADASWSIRRRPIGHICAGTRTARISGMRVGGWPGWARRSTRRLISRSSTLASRRRRLTSWYLSTNRS